MYSVKTNQTLEFSTNRLVTDASELGFPPGNFPNQLEAVDIGNRLPFVLTTVNEDFASYKQEFGCVTLTVYND